MQDCKVNVLGIDYNIIPDEELQATENDGSCDKYSKEIRIRPIAWMLDNSANDKSKKMRFEEVVRHEIIHAFLFESGLDEYSYDESLVDWIAVQFPKMESVFKKLGVL